MPLPSANSLSLGSAVPLTSGTPATVASLTLSGGNYLVWGGIDAALSAATLTALIASLSLVSGALAAQSGSMVPPANRLLAEPVAQALRNLVTATGTESLAAGPTALAIAPNTTATLYLVAQATFSAGSVSVYGTLFSLPLLS